MDSQISRWIVETFGESEVFANVFKWITYAGSKWVIIGLILVLALFKKNWKMCLSAVIAVGSVYIFNDFIFKELVARPRPFVDDSTLTAICELANLELPTGYSMASGHAAVSMAFAMTVMLYNWKLGIPAVVYSFLIGLSRVCLCVHYLSDVLVGFAFGIIFALAVFFAFKLIIKLYKNRRKSNEKFSSGN